MRRAVALKTYGATVACNHDTASCLGKNGKAGDNTQTHGAPMPQQ